jgi:hypothetical protein
MYVSRETPAQTETRLRKIIARARIHRYPSNYKFMEFPVAAPPSPPPSEALAMVWDDTAWSILVPALQPSDDDFRI